MISKPRCISCKNEITWQNMLKPKLNNYYVNFRKINCSYCKSKLVFNNRIFLISHIIFCILLGITLSISNIPGYLAIFTGLLAILLLGMPTERLLNVFFSLFFPLELDENEISPK